MTQEIHLPSGDTTIVDDCDYDFLCQFKWHLYPEGKNKYAIRQVRVDGVMKVIRMHRVIASRMGLDIEHQGIDHRNGNGLDNRRTNLRLATNSQNQRNRALTSLSKTGYKGVFNQPKCATFRAALKIHGKVISLGTFRDPIDAARAYDEAARKYFGEYARTNFDVVAGD